jgi:hypothetical protein
MYEISGKVEFSLQSWGREVMIDDRESKESSPISKLA